MQRHFVPIKIQHFFDKLADTKILKMISRVIYAIKIFKKSANENANLKMVN